MNIRLENKPKTFKNKKPMKWLAEIGTWERGTYHEINVPTKEEALKIAFSIVEKTLKENPSLSHREYDLVQLTCVNDKVIVWDFFNGWLRQND